MTRKRLLTVAALALGVAACKPPVIPGAVAADTAAKAPPCACAPVKAASVNGAVGRSAKAAGPARAAARPVVRAGTRRRPVRRWEGQVAAADRAYQTVDAETRSYARPEIAGPPPAPYAEEARESRYAAVQGRAYQSDTFSESRSSAGGGGYVGGQALGGYVQGGYAQGGYRYSTARAYTVSQGARGDVARSRAWIRTRCPQ